MFLVLKIAHFIGKDWLIVLHDITRSPIAVCPGLLEVLIRVD